MKKILYEILILSLIENHLKYEYVSGSVSEHFFQNFNMRIKTRSAKNDDVTFIIRASTGTEPLYIFFNGADANRYYVFALPLHFDLLRLMAFSV